MLVRDRARAERLGLPADVMVEAGLDDIAGMRAAARDVEVVVHLAGAVRAVSQRDLMHTNADGTAHLIAALPDAARVVLVSSLAAAGPSIDGRGTASVSDACRPCSHYGESKRRGELALLAEAARSRRPWLVLRPCLVYGPDDGATALLLRQARALLCPVPWRPRPLSTVHVRDVVAALLAAIEQRDACGEFLPIAGEVTDTHAFLRALAAAQGRHARLLRVPTPLAVVGGHVADAWAQLTRRPSYFSRDKVREITAKGFVADREPARRSLGFTASVPLLAGLAETVQG